MASFLTRHFSWFSCPRFHFLKWWTRKNYEINSEQPAVRKEEQSRSRFPAGGRISGFQIRFLDKKRGEKHKLLTGFLKGWLGYFADLDFGEKKEVFCFGVGLKNGSWSRRKGISVWRGRRLRGRIIELPEELHFLGFIAEGIL
ncbi:hypothetical protein SLEP1_g19025 [Rubroshorea leprosula]|nr:hypothetical protein SLEP1_g19025 [Rubroshorea leprosula]